MKYNSDFYGNGLTEEQVFEYVIKHTETSKWEIIVGTDSQQRKDKLKIATVIVLVERIEGVDGGGRIWFDTTEIIPAPEFLAKKIYEEATRSIQTADRLFAYLVNNLDDEGFRKRAGSGLGVHADIGENGKTNSLISGIVGYIEGSGYKATIKPDSYVASVIADRLSK
jgi:hypothetical protein